MIKCIPILFYKNKKSRGLTPALSTEEDREKWVVLCRQELASFLKDIKGRRDYALIYVAAYTGARQSELLGLTWDKVRFKDKAIRIEQTLHRDKDSDSGFEERPRTKRKSSTRTIPVTNRVIKVLEKHRQEQIAAGIESKHVFLEPDGNFIDASNLGRRFKRLAKNYPGMTFHHLRHTHATILLSEGANINEVAERLGHANAAITLKTYGHVLPDRPQSLANFFDSLIDDDNE
jgi:integrase